MQHTENENPELKLAYGFVQNTAENVFLTGKAGTGKTTFLHNLKKISPKRMVVLAPTGVAAINAGGATIHSFFQMPFGPWVSDGSRESGVMGQSKKPAVKFHRFSREKLNIIRSLHLVVIDEISMVRADLLDGIDEVLRRFRDRDKPFGGVQLLMIGDLQQLAPVVKDDEWEILKQHYDTPFFFGSRALAQSSYLTIELKRIYRQSDQEFIDLLNKIRHSDRSPDTLAQINKRYRPGIKVDKEGGIILTTHNYQAKRINDERMGRLAGKSYTFCAQVEGDFPEYAYPTDLELKLKIDAQVMFVKNDISPEKRYFNGKIGSVKAIDDDVVYVKCPGDDTIIAVVPDCWQNVKYGLNNETGEIVETVNGTFTQYPLKAAWAITIHKSQGLTFDRVIIDAAGAFAHGQVYVALSRCRTLEGLTLTSQLSPRVLISSSSVSKFSRCAEKNQPGELQLQRAQIAYQHTLLHELFDFSSLHRQIGYLLKLVNENRGSIHSSLVESVQTIAAGVKSDISDVAEKFSSRIVQLLLQEENIEKNGLLQERVKKATSYFVDKIETCIGNFSRIGKIEIDNQEVRKLLTDSLRRLDEERIKKTACLEACQGGFFMKAYLEARAKAAIEKPVIKRNVPQADGAFSGDHAVLHQLLQSWRAEKALSRNLPQYMILPHKTMVEICARLPESFSKLKTIKGLGKRKLEEFGGEILEIITRYCSEYNIPVTQKDELGEQSQHRGVKINTKQVSLDFLNSGKSLTEIAELRNLTLSTIEGHLSHFISTGELSIFKVMTAERVSEISDFFIIHNTRGLTLARNHFGSRVSFGELRMVIGHLRVSEQNDFRDDFVSTP